MDSFYTVIRGDSLFGIAQRFYGDGRLYRLIAEANHIPNPSRIFPGQVLVIPRRPARPAAALTAPAAWLAVVVGS